MANKQVFTAYDVYGFKRALALHGAKNNALISKYEQLLKLANSDEDELYLQAPSHNRELSLSSIACKKSCYRKILEDLRKPCDTFISELECQNVGKEFV